jgi:ADP-ribose pyrophosphatase
MKVVLKKTKRVFDEFFKIDRAVLQYEQFDGALTDDVVRLNFDRGDSVAALLVDWEKEKIILIKQFRYPVFSKEQSKAWTWEIVAGMVEEDVSLEESIKREIAEETGYSISKVQLLFSFYPTPGGSNEKVYLYYAEVNQKGQKLSGGGVKSEGEDILVQEFSFYDVLKMIDSAEIIDAKTIIALLWFKEKKLKILSK